MASTVSSAPAVVTAPGISIRRLLGFALSVHLVVVFFQIPIRATIIDSTFVRDVPLWICLGLLGLDLLAGIKAGRRGRPHWLDVVVVMYLTYGVGGIFLGMSRGMSLIQAGLEFRNFFLPVSLYFVARRVMSREAGQQRFTGFLLTFTGIFVADVLAEYVALVLGIDRGGLPWYRYMFFFSDRFIGNAIGAVGYVLPSDSPVLGLNGYPHYTAPTLVALFAFANPYLSERLTQPMRGWGRRIGRAPIGLRRSLIVLAVLATIVLRVRTHILSLMLVFAALPLLTGAKFLRRNLTIIAVTATVIVLVGSTQFPVVAMLRQAFVGEDGRPSTLSLIVTPQETRYLLTQPWRTFLFGLGALGDLTMMEKGGSFEIKVLQFTAAFGVVWFTLFWVMIVTGLLYARRLVLSAPAGAVRVFGMGALGLLVVFSVDMGHYARSMFAPNIDLWSACLGGVAALTVQTREERRQARLRRSVQPKATTS